jgi:Flp pilus assembly protein TadD
MMSGNNAAAATSFRRALVIEPTLDIARLNLGRMALGSEPAQAEILFTAILAHDDSNIQALNNLGVAQDLQGRHADAQATYRRVLAIAPEQGSARQNLGLSLAVSGAPDQAVAMLGSISGHQTADRRARDNLAVALALAGRSTEASQMLREELSPADAARMMAGLKGFTP